MRQSPDDYCLIHLHYLAKDESDVIMMETLRIEHDPDKQDGGYTLKTAARGTALFMKPTLAAVLKSLR